MIVVVASSHDARARGIVAHWGSRCAAMLTAEDLSRPGWSFSVPASGRGSAVISGQRVPLADITGILTLRPAIFQEELPQIHAEDRGYVAAEMNAFLSAWLASQSCPVLNRPSASCLAGPNWRQEQWTQAAARIGIPVRPSARHVPFSARPAEDEEIAETVTVGGECFGAHDRVFDSWTRALARAAGVDFLCARFCREQGRFVSAHPWPPLTNPEVLAALRSRLEAA